MLQYFKFLKRAEMQDIIITLKIEKEKPLSLQKLSSAILSLNHSIGNFVRMDKGLGGVELQLKSVEKGSDIFNFLVTISSLLPLKDCADALNSYFTLWDNLKKIKQQSVENVQKEKYIDKVMFKDMNNIIGVYSTGANAQITSNISNNSITINKNSYHMYNESLECISKIKGFNELSRVKSIFQNMTIEFYQTTNTQKPLKHKAFCYELECTPKDIFIDDERLKKEMLENPYYYKFLVDLEVYKDENNRISTYRAYNYKDKILK